MSVMLIDLVFVVKNEVDGVLGLNLLNLGFDI